MSAITPQLRASARAAYRSIHRAATKAFYGDPEIRRAFAVKTRSDFASASTVTDPTAYMESVKLANDIAGVLTKNVVQGRRNEDGVYNLRITKDTELGSNETIKNPPPMERPSRARRRAQEAATMCSGSASNTDTISPEPKTLTLNYSALKKASREREIPALNEDELEESFVKGGGPGGQCINKRSTNVDLLHIPSGIRIQCQETRSLQENRRIARKLLARKLDEVYNPGISREALLDAKVKERKRRKAKKARKKSREGSEESANSSTV